MTPEYYPVPLLHLLKHENLFSGIEIHVKIAEKYVRLNFAEEPYKDILEKLHKKSVDQVYISEEDLAFILSKFSGALESGAVDLNTFNEEIRANTADVLFSMSRDFIKDHGVSSELVGAMSQATLSVQTMIEKSDGLAAFLRKFEEECSEEFLKINVTTFLTSAVIKHFPWKSQQIIEKTMLAAMFCDITLSYSDLAKVSSFETVGGELSLELKRHPLNAIHFLAHKLDVIPMETLTIIEQHHEKPDGTGFPNGIDISRFNQLSAIFIICQRFTDELFANEFDTRKHTESLDLIRDHYHGAVFAKAIEALVKVVAVDSLKA